MPQATLTFQLPEEQDSFSAAVNGSRAQALIEEIDQRLRNMLKHGDPGEETATLAEDIRQMIADEGMAE